MRVWCSVLTIALAAAGLAVAASPAPPEGVPTKVQVRVVSHDAKVIGDMVGGARVTIREAATGRVLTEGLQEGATGDTNLIMVQPRERGATVYGTPGAAGFLATVMLEEPTEVEIVAEGPLGAPQATRRMSKTLLLVPGQDVLGEGILLEIHGFIVSLLAPSADTSLARGQPVGVRATVTMA